jgi:magnesium transporter
VTAVLLDREGTEQARIDRASVESRLTSGEFFWLDLHAPDEQELVLLRDVFGFHPLAVEDSEHFRQRPKLEDYGDYAFLVVYGAAPEPDEDRLVELHCFYSERFLVTVRKDESPALNRVRERHARRPGAPTRPIVLLYRLLDALVDSFFPALDDVDERLRALEDRILVAPQDEELEEVYALRRRLAGLRWAVGPQRDLVGQLVGGARDLPGLDGEARRYFRDVHDHLIRIAEQIDMERDLLVGTMDVYLSSASNRLSAVTKQLAVIATIFLPLTFVTGFFGQNFGWMVEHVGSWPAFVLLGVGLQIAALAVLLVYFKKRNWF